MENQQLQASIEREIQARQQIEKQYKQIQEEIEQHTKLVSLEEIDQ